MKILFFLPELGGGGAQRTLVNLANAMRAHDEVTLAVAKAEGPAKAWLDAAVPLVDLRCGRTRNAVLPLASLIARLQPDVVLSSMVDANIVSWLARRLTRAHKPKLILRETNSHRARGDLNWLRRQLIGRAYHGADAVVSLSNGVREELIELYALAPEGIVTIPNPVAVSALRQTAARARSGPAPWPKSGRAIIGVGRLTRQKGFDLLLPIFAELPDKDLQLVLIGEGEQRAELEAMARSLGIDKRLFMPGFVHEPMQWLAHADVFALPSRWEGFGHVIVEAMAADIPVVAFDCPHGPRDIIGDGRNGLLVPLQDTAGFGEALARVLSDKQFASGLVQEARGDAERYALDDIAKRYLQLFIRTTDLRAARGT